MKNKYAYIFIRTGILDKLGLNSPRNNVSIDEIDEILSRIDAEYYVLVLDVFYPYIEYFLHRISGRIDKDVIVFMAKPQSPIVKVFHHLAYNPLSDIIGSKLGLAVIISRRLVEKVKNSGIKNMLSYAERIQAISLHEPIYDYFYMIYGRLPKPLLVTLLEPIRLVKFGLVGLSGILVNYIAIQYSLQYLPNILSRLARIFIASIIGFEVSLSWNFMLHELWTFKDLKLDKTFLGRVKRWLKYHLASIGGLASQTISITILTGLLGIHLASSLLIGVVIGFIVNYLVGRFYTWRK